MDNKAVIKVDAGAIQKTKINPYIFGHFVEDIRDHMDAMLAFVLKDMDFEDEAVIGVSAGWYPIINGKNTKFELEPAAPKHSVSCVSEFADTLTLFAVNLGLEPVPCSSGDTY